MNKLRRSSIQSIIDALGTAQSDVENVQYEEQDCLDNLPENLQSSERADRMQEAIDALEEAADLISQAVEQLNAVME